MEFLRVHVTSCHNWKHDRTATRSWMTQQLYSSPQTLSCQQNQIAQRGKQICFLLSWPLDSVPYSLMSWLEDGMDQSKWCLPRCRNNIVTKSLAKHERVRTKIQGVWLHQVALFLYCLDARLSADSSMVIECVSRSMDRMADICRAHGRDSPRKLVLWAPSLEIFSSH